MTDVNSTRGKDKSLYDFYEFTRGRKEKRFPYD
jgi:hypothetical protein